MGRRATRGALAAVVMPTCIHPVMPVATAALAAGVGGGGYAGRVVGGAWAAAVVVGAVVGGWLLWRRLLRWRLLWRRLLRWRLLWRRLLRRRLLRRRASSTRGRPLRLLPSEANLPGLLRRLRHVGLLWRGLPAGGLRIG